MRAQIKKTRTATFISRTLFVILALSFTLVMSGCQYRARTFVLPQEYHGTVWECADPHVVFEVDDEGYCIGTLVLEDVSLPIRVNLFDFKEGRTAQIFVSEEDRHVHIFGGQYNVVEDRIVVTGKWSESLKEYSQSYDPNEFTMIFERRK